MQFDLFRNAQATEAVAALNHASMASTVLEKIAASSVQRAAALPAVTRAEFDAAELERRQHFAAVGIDGNALVQRYGVFFGCPAPSRPQSDSGDQGRIAVKRRHEDCH